RLVELKRQRPSTFPQNVHTAAVIKKKKPLNSAIFDVSRPIYFLKTCGDKEQSEGSATHQLIRAPGDGIQFDWLCAVRSNKPS
ncbi:hypothetical protein AOLI_G00304280, partial [Acnodon oligacanthus]